MASDILSAISNQSSSTTLTRATSQTLDQDAFLQILVAQLQNQDPMQPLEDKEFISQMAQFSSLEQLQALTQSTQMAQAFGMVGQSVETVILDASGSAQEISGVVDRAYLQNQVPYLEVNGISIPYTSDIQVVLPNETVTTTPIEA